MTICGSALEEADRIIKDEQARLVTAKLLRQSNDFQVQAHRAIMDDAIEALEAPPVEATTPTSEVPWLSYAHLASVAAGENEFTLAASRLATALTLADPFEAARVVEAFAAGRSREEVDETMTYLRGRRLPADVLVTAAAVVEKMEWGKR